ncbi:MAG: ATP-binding protein, partial [Bacteroidota bacterium]
YVIKYDLDENFQCLIGIFRDVSSEKILRERVILSQDKLEFAELILEISQKLARIGTWRFQLKTRKLHWSDNLHKMLDIPKSTNDLYDTFIAQIHPDDVEGFLATFDHAVQTKSSYTVQYRCIKPNGQVVYSFGNGHPIFASDGEIEGYFGLSQDISELKIAQIKLENINKHLEAKVLERTKELEHSSQKMQLVLEQLQRQNEQLQQYTYIVSHNLRAPVANIHGLSELFDPRDTSSEENQQIIHNISRLSRQLDQIIIDLNEILSSEGKLELAFSDVNLSYEIKRVCEELSPQIMNSRAEIEMKVPDNLFIKTVKGYIFSIIHNLLENALKFKAENRKLRIEIGAKKEGTQYKIWLKDNGQGLDLKKDEQKLFKLHSRLHDTGTQGMGMGLFLVKSHIEQMGGSVEVDSEIDKGSCFTIRIPQSD